MTDVYFWIRCTIYIYRCKISDTYVCIWPNHILIWDQFHNTRTLTNQSFSFFFVCVVFNLGETSCVGRRKSVWKNPPNQRNRSGRLCIGGEPLSKKQDEWPENSQHARLQMKNDPERWGNGAFRVFFQLRLFAAHKCFN